MRTPTGLRLKAIAAIPIAAVGVVWVVDDSRTQVVDVAAMSAPPDAGTPGTSDGTAPADTVVPPAAPLVVPATGQGPASAWRRPSRGAAGARAAAARATSSDIPAVALAAYQRAATAMNAADAACHLDWSLLAAVGRIESHHGSHGRSRVGADGVARPRIVGPALTGADGTRSVTDTDGGAYDGDRVYDHAVGPMQFLPSTWAVIGVDGDGDGARNPQDIDDAALAAAVYLCSGSDDLATDAGRREAALRYNHDAAYADAVVATADAYQASGGVYAALAGAPGTLDVRALALGPVTTVAATDIVRTGHHGGGRHGAEEAAEEGSGGTRHGRRHRHHGARGGLTEAAHQGQSNQAGDQAGDQAGGRPGSVTEPGSPSAPSTPSTPTRPSTPSDPTPDPTPAGPTPADPTPADPTPPAPVPATAGQLTQMCTDAVVAAHPQAPASAVSRAVVLCVAALDSKTPDAARDALPGVLATLPERVPALTAKDGAGEDGADGAASDGDGATPQDGTTEPTTAP